ncbi:MAG: aspartoacylase [Fibromonadaceae bacterium]|jgi:succinylglutamate desuccinylase|nr:aspartoacylase [Fibromonadaceae bacterium]
MEFANKIAVCGGTHGNELTGIYLAKKHGWLLANPAAAEKRQRYIDTDLNRCFAMSSLSAEKKGLESIRAKELNAMLGQKGAESAHDLILDIHNTTANMGITLILSSKDQDLVNISACIAKEFAGVRIYLQQESREESPYLGTIAKKDVCIEAGPQAHGTLNSELFFKVEQVVFRFLELIEAWKNGSLPKANGSIELFVEMRNLDYPRDRNGNIAAMVHPALQGRDFCELRTGMPIFMGFDGNEVFWEGETCYPAFINEAAYYEKGIAMSLTKSSSFTL